ncbi:hypothetical protein UCRPA7_737 [Phaeoacremonium minimum UCRPA7]|uniref:DUF7918 domain-containing protein n=1 Tax=Phaeoacremonium minimum (strain UCR-PA7) TaxID=1286976 RepID=R8BWF5_PHAM7|nr:hypothetical protein UCRPA7_737 [Phaeoacremonium minimum UCRPA7]EOO03678.1 hypothetical protein UCRPA7_737 [Phaeoacremonium minimum UCRPA7]
MQKQSRFSRISSYIPVPQPNVTGESNKAEPAKFAISITLLTPGLPIPYSTPKATEANPYPKPQVVGQLPSQSGERGKYNGVVSPYIQMTNSDNETIAAYIYFDGRSKEEVATLLRPGEETWVNSRWVQVPDAEGGGLAEREFLFREVGLERWLNGLDLKGHDAAEKLEKRRQKFEKRRRRQRAAEEGNGMEFEKKDGTRDTLRYGNDDGSPVEAVFDEDDSDSLSDDDDIPEATGQIKVAMFRVIASGEIKKGEYSPQFDAHDDDDEFGAGNSNGVDADVEHTTSFAKPKTLDPKTISTQTVTGIDGPDKPYATFTFFYRGERQLQKVGILPSSKGQQTTPSAAKRRSAQLDFSTLGPLKTTGTVGFSAFRDQDTESARRRKSRKKSNGSAGGAMDEDSDDDDDSDAILGKMEDIDEKEDKTKLVGPDDATFSGELADGVNRIRLKRQLSAEPESASISSRKSPSTGPFGESTPSDSTSAIGQPIPGASAASLLSKSVPDDAIVGSPLKKQRASIFDGDSSRRETPQLGDILAKAEAAQKNQASPALPPAAAVKQEDSDEEL